MLENMLAMLVNKLVNKLVMLVSKLVTLESMWGMLVNSVVMWDCNEAKLVNMQVM